MINGAATNGTMPLILGQLQQLCYTRRTIPMPAFPKNIRTCGLRQLHLCRWSGTYRTRIRFKFTQFKTHVVFVQVRGVSFFPLFSLLIDFVFGDVRFQTRKSTSLNCTFHPRAMKFECSCVSKKTPCPCARAPSLQRWFYRVKRFCF